MTYGKFVEKCEGVILTMNALVEQAKRGTLDSEMVFDKEAAPIIAGNLRDLASTIESSTGDKPLA
ncbi:MAG: hypothetical protein WC998_07630 [Candidatus Paceibacterota bacterium]|jgi:hypothetical protein